MVRHYVRKRTFSTAERVLVHLSSEALQLPEQTQEGIAAATRSGRSTLTKWLSRLGKRRLVTRDRIRLPGHPLPKYAYRLTEAGWRSALALRKRLEAELVIVRAPNLGALTVRLTEVPDLACAQLDLTGAVAALRKGRLDLAKATATVRKQRPAIWGTGLRRLDRLFGREEELRDLDAWWSSGSRVLVLTGLAGIGKSAFVAAWAQGRPVDTPVYGFEARPSSTVAGFMSDFGTFLASLGKPGLAVHLAQGVPLDPGFVSRLLDRDLEGERILLIVDNADQVSRALAQFLVQLFLGEPRRFSPRVLLVARRPPRWFKGAVPRTGRPVRRLRGLTRDASLALLRSRGLGPAGPFTEEVVRQTRGHPLLLHLVASTGLSPGSMVKRYIEQEVWQNLPPRDRSILEAASVFRKAVSRRTLGRVARADDPSLEKLADRNLLERTLAGTYGMHDLVREFVGAQMRPSRQRTLHARAANAMLKGADSRERWEGIYHLLAAGLASRAAALLDSEGAPLLDCVAAEEIASLVHGIALDEGDPETYCVFAEVLGDSLRIRGHVGPAFFQYEHAQRLAENSGQIERIPRLLRKVAFLERCRNRYAKALGYLVEARARLGRLNNSPELIEVLREMALAEQALGNLEDAARYLNEAVDLATEASDRAALSRTLLALGSLESQRGRLAAGLSLDLEGLRIAQRSGNVTEVAHAHIVVGTALIALGRAAESLRDLSEGYEAARLLGNLRLMAYATSNQTSALLRLRRYREASVSLQQAKDCFEVLEEKDTVGFLKTYEAELEMGLGHWSRASHAWREGIAQLRSHGSPAELAWVLWDVAGFCAAHGDVEEGQSYLTEAREIARKVGNQELLSRIETDLRRLRATPATNSHA